MCRSKTERAARGIIVAATLGALLAGCSDIYYDRRDPISLGAGDAIAANEANQVFDPWPRHSANIYIPGNGEKMQSAIQRYRTDRVTPPANVYNSAIEHLQEQQAAAPAGSGTSGSASASAASSQ